MICKNCKTESEEGNAYCHKCGNRLALNNKEVNLKNLIPIKVITSLFLFIDVISVPYGYYNLLRVIVCGACAYIAVSYNKLQIIDMTIKYAGIAFLFNPLFPIHLFKEAWILIDLIIAGYLLYTIYSDSKLNKIIK